MIIIIIAIISKIYKHQKKFILNIPHIIHRTTSYSAYYGLATANILPLDLCVSLIGQAIITLEYRIVKNLNLVTLPNYDIRATTTPAVKSLKNMINDETLTG